LGKAFRWRCQHPENEDTMLSIQALREQRNTKATALTALITDTEGKPWMPENQSAYDKLVADIDADDAHIARVQTAIDKAAAVGQVLDGLADRDGKKLGHVKAEEEKRLEVFKRYLRNGWSALSIDEVQKGRVRAAQSEGTSTAGGYLVPVTTIAQLLVELKAYGGMRSVAQILQTDSGESWNWPTLDDTAQVGELIAENVTATSQDMTFGQATIQPYKFSSKVFAVPFELLQDSVVDVESIVNSAAATRIGRIQNTYFTTGTGTAQPKGIVTAAASGKVGLVGQTLSIIYDDLVDLEHSIDPAYRTMPGVGWMMHDSSLKVLKKLKDSQNRPLWLPGLSGLSGPIAAPTLMGYGYTINQDMPVMAANAKSLLFGVMSRYLIRDVMQMQLFRFDDSAYIKLGQIGFLMWARAAGNYIASSSSSLKYYANSAT
jgi:HK97 family phage major capsid protein